jgi:2'-5' RNA ligase
MAETAADLLASTPPAAVTLGQVLYHSEPIMLGVTPAETLTAIYNAARWATHQVTGEQTPDGQPARWRPHITICYSTSSQPAKPIIESPSCQ